MPPTRVLKIWKSGQFDRRSQQDSSPSPARPTLSGSPIMRRVIFTDTEHAGRHNRVEGGDVAIKFSPPQSFSATFLTSQTGISSADQTHGCRRASYPTATTPGASAGAIRSSTTAATSRWTRRSTIALALPRAGRSANSISIRRKAATSGSSVFSLSIGRNADTIRCRTAARTISTPASALTLRARVS